jgi:hypothetical protein
MQQSRALSRTPDRLAAGEVLAVDVSKLPLVLAKATVTIKY